MKIRLLMAAATLAAACMPAAAQSVSGLSVKRTLPASAAPAEGAEPDSKRIQTLLDLVKAIAAAKTPAERAKLEQQLANLTQLPESGTSVNLAVPAGATASLGEEGDASAGPRLGFQAWKPDDFFAGAFFTFDTAPTLNGDLRKAGQFLRDPPNAGTSFLVSGNRMFTKYRCGHFVGVRSITHQPKDPCENRAGDRKDALIFGLSGRIGATTTTLEHKPVAEEGTEPAPAERHEASVFHVTVAGLVTSRTFRTEEGGEYQFGLEAGLTYRKVLGDAAQHPDFLSKPDVFGHDRTSFGGWDATFFARLNGFQPFVRFTHISRKGNHVPGLTGTQASIGVNVLSSLFHTTREGQPDEKPKDPPKKDGQ